MKKIYLLLCFVACLLASCLEDKGNDLYIELNDVTIGKIRDTTTVYPPENRTGDYNSFR